MFTPEPSPINSSYSPSGRRHDDYFHWSSLAGSGTCARKAMVPPVPFACLGLALCVPPMACMPVVDSVRLARGLGTTRLFFDLPGASCEGLEQRTSLSFWTTCSFSISPHTPFVLLHDCPSSLYTLTGDVRTYLGSISSGLLSLTDSAFFFFAGSHLLEELACVLFS